MGKSLDSIAAAVAAPLAGADIRKCKKTRQLVIFVATGPARGWWKSADQCIAAAAADRRFKKAVGSPDWAAITEMIKAIIEAIGQTKG